MTKKHPIVNEPTAFSKAVIRLIQQIPKGKVATYGQIAELAGKSHGARGVAWLLSSSTIKHDLPWHRVINSKGMISFPEMSESYLRQKKLLEKEGLTFENGKISLKLFLWKKVSPKKKQPLKL